MEACKTDLRVDDAGLARRCAARAPAARRCQRGFARRARQHAAQARAGCDFDFLDGAAPRPQPWSH